MRLSFIQSNWLRQYPFKSDCGIDDNAGQWVPTDLVVGLRLSLPKAMLSNTVFIGKLVTGNNSFSAELFCGTTLVGTVAAIVTISNQIVPILNSTGGTIGTITTGNSDNFQINQSYTFNSTNGAVEESTITAIPTPAVTSLCLKGVNLTGNLTLASNTIDITAGLFLSLLDPQSVSSRKDKQAVNLTCDLPIIGGINTVLPDVANQISIVAVAPLTVSSLGNGVLQLTVSPITKTTLCIPYNTPPDNTSNTPAGDLSSSSPEYLTWPQFE